MSRAVAGELLRILYCKVDVGVRASARDLLVILWLVA